MTASEDVVLEATGLRFRHDAEWGMDRISLRLRRRQTIGVLGGNECGKTTLAQLLLGNLKPDGGRVSPSVQGVQTGRNQAHSLALPFRVLLLISTIGLSLLAMFRRGLYIYLMQSGLYAPVLLLLLLEAARMYEARRLQSELEDTEGWSPPGARALGIGYISSEHDAAQKLPGHLLVEEVIGARMPMTAREEKRLEVLAALHASGFQMYSDNGKPVGNAETYLAQGLKMGELSGGQKHLVYILAVLASRPRVLICDEMLCGLDIDRQASVLRMLQQLQHHFGTAILYMSVDLSAVEIMAQQTIFMHDGRFIEKSEGCEMLESPRTQEARLYVQQSKEITSHSRGSNLLNAFTSGKSVFS